MYNSSVYIYTQHNIYMQHDTHKETERQRDRYTDKGRIEVESGEIQSEERERERYSTVKHTVEMPIEIGGGNEKKEKRKQKLFVE